MKLLTFILAILLLTGCGRSPDPPASKSPSAPLVVLVGGLDTSQLGSVESLVKTEFTRYQVASFGPENGWKGDVNGWIAKNYTGTAPPILIGHSFGGDKVCEVAAQLPTAKLILLDPVCNKLGQSEITIPANCPSAIVIRASATLGINQATVHGVFTEYHVHREHSAVCHDPETLQIVREALQ